MEPSWVRPAYLYLLSLVGVVVMAVGAVFVLLGVVHAISPELQRQGDPVFRAASAILDVAEVYVREAGSEETLPPGVDDSLDEARAELDSQARHAGVNQLITGLIIFLVGAVVFGFHWRRAERGSRAAEGATARAAGPPTP
jgi:predicted membrane channel-forming protein YqfA (hemolysin III family)